MRNVCTTLSHKSSTYKQISSLLTTFQMPVLSSNASSLRKFPTPIWGRRNFWEAKANETISLQAMLGRRRPCEHHDQNLALDESRLMRSVFPLVLRPNLSAAQVGVKSQHGQQWNSSSSSSQCGVCSIVVVVTTAPVGSVLNGVPWCDTAPCTRSGSVCIPSPPPAPSPAAGHILI